MQFFKKNIFLIFWIIALGEIVSQFFEFPLLHLILKPLLLPLLIAGTLFHAEASSQRHRIVAGLFLSFLGDVFLLFESKNQVFFIVGLVCFLLAHIFYCWYFLQIRKTNISLLKQKPWLIFLILIYTGSLIVLLMPLGELTVPVIAYACVLTSMLICCLRAYNYLSPEARNLLLSGAIFFVISDSLLAINKFYASFSTAGFFIMLTYCLAQYLIVIGFIKNR